jgi:ankyrin repeat protein
MGAEVAAKDNNGADALQFAALHGYEVVLRQLLKHGADVEAKTGKRLTALLLATRV